MKSTLLFIVSFIESLLYKIYKSKYRHGGGYQPLPDCGFTTSKRGDATLERWKLLHADISQHGYTGSALDIGCNIGFFAWKLSSMGFLAIGLDHNPNNSFYSLTAQRYHRKSNICFITADLNPSSVHLLPDVDVTVFFSVWHHWIGMYGLDESQKMLQQLFKRTKSVLYFETGEDTELDKLNIPRDKSFDWVLNQLETNCPESTIELLGATDSGQHLSGLNPRHLFAVRKSPNA